MSLDYGIKISKAGESVQSAAKNDIIFSTQFDTLKVVATGTVTLSLPSESVNGTQAHTETYAHGLGYTPLYWPDIHDAENTDFATTDDFVLNDNNQNIPPIGAYSPPLTGEKGEVYVDATSLTVKVTRVSALGPTSFGAHDAIYYYTIFYNKATESLDLL